MLLRVLAGRARRPRGVCVKQRKPAEPPRQPKHMIPSFGVWGNPTRKSPVQPVGQTRRPTTQTSRETRPDIHIEQIRTLTETPTAAMGQRPGGSAAWECSVRHASIQCATLPACELTRPVLSSSASSAASLVCQQARRVKHENNITTSVMRGCVMSLPFEERRPCRLHPQMKQSCHHQMRMCYG